MKRTLFTLTLFTSISAYSQTWDRITPVQANLYEPTGDIEWYEPGAPHIPAPREAAQLWQTSTGTVYLYGGRGYDQNLETGLFRDNRTYTKAALSTALSIMEKST